MQLVEQAFYFGVPSAATRTAKHRGKEKPGPEVDGSMFPTALGFHGFWGMFDPFGSAKWVKSDFRWPTY